LGTHTNANPIGAAYWQKSHQPNAQAPQVRHVLYGSEERKANSKKEFSY
jgi:hypothetical protein